jgi:hypothetical protein
MTAVTVTRQRYICIKPCNSWEKGCHSATLTLPQCSHDPTNAPCQQPYQTVQITKTSMKRPSHFGLCPSSIFNAVPQNFIYNISSIQYNRTNKMHYLLIMRYYINKNWYIFGLYYISWVLAGLEWTLAVYVCMLCYTKLLGWPYTVSLSCSCISIFALLVGSSKT